MIDLDISRLFGPPPDQNNIIRGTHQVMWEHMNYDNNLRDHGFYEVGGNHYYNKIQAILDSHLLGRPLRWNYLDQEFDQHDWTQEPAESLAQLYCQRAQQLREKYDYLVLHFSGGSDSCNVLETFINNNIHLDEVLIRGSYSQASINKGLIASTEGYGECISQGLPLAQWVKDNRMPHLRITLVDTTSMINDYFDRNSDWVENSGPILTPSFGWKAALDSISPHYQELTERGLRVAHIYGADKPNLYRHKNIFYTQWKDTQTSMFAATRNSNVEIPLYIECFYWGRHTVRMQIKQLHALKNHIKANNIPDHVFDAKKAIDLGMDPATVQRHADNYKASVIYHRTLPLLTEPLKPSGNRIISDVDAWFTKDLHSQAFCNYRRGIEYLNTILPKHHICSGGIWSSTGINPIHSKPRYLGT